MKTANIIAKIGLVLIPVGFLGFVIGGAIFDSNLLSIIFWIFMACGIFLLIFSGIKSNIEKQKLDQEYVQNPLKIPVNEPNLKQSILKQLAHGNAEGSVKSLISVIKDESSPLFQELLQLQNQNYKARKRCDKRNYHSGARKH